MKESGGAPSTTSCPSADSLLYHNCTQQQCCKRDARHSRRRLKVRYQDPVDYWYVSMKNITNCLMTRLPHKIVGQPIYMGHATMDTPTLCRSAEPSVEHAQHWHACQRHCRCRRLRPVAKEPGAFGGNPDDHNILRAHFGPTIGGGAGASTNAAIPDPATAMCSGAPGNMTRSMIRIFRGRFIDWLS